VSVIKKIKIKIAVNTMLVLLSFVLVFHLLVLLGIIPFSIVWGGRLQNASQMYVFEAVSIIINLFIISAIAMKGVYIKQFLSKRTIRFILWVLVVVFSLNTFGNIFSESTLETILFTPLTLISTILCYRMAIEK